MHQPNPLAGAGIDARARYAAIGEEWLRRFAVTLTTTEHTGLTGRAYVKRRTIKTPWPASTLKRLYILAHEIGHVVLGHTDTIGHYLPSYVREFECEMFAHALMREEGLRVPKDMTDRAKAYVARRMRQGVGSNLRKPLDTGIIAWCGPHLTATTIKIWRDLNPWLFSGSPRFFQGAKARVRAALDAHKESV